MDGKKERKKERKNHAREMCWWERAKGRERLLAMLLLLPALVWCYNIM